MVAAKTRSGYQYRCIITDQYGDNVTTDAATLTVITKTELAITAQPEDASIAKGGSAVFVVTTQGDGLSYQWQYRTSPGGSWKNSTGGTADTLTISALAYRNGYQYQCIVTDQYGDSVTTDPATLTVT